MPSVPRILRVLASFALTMLAACVANFVLQIGMIFLDVLTRLESSSAAILALWFVTGVFTTVIGIGELDRPPGNGRFGGTVVLVLSVVAIAAAIVLAWNDCPGGDPLDFSLMFTNVWVVIAFFAGSGAMAAVIRLADTPAPRKPSAPRNPSASPATPKPP
jgi:hypothetical protein